MQGFGPNQPQGRSPDHCVDRTERLVGELTGGNPDGTISTQPQERDYPTTGLVDRDGCFERYRKSPSEIGSLPRKLRAFYARQNELLDLFREVDQVINSRASIALRRPVQPHRACVGYGNGPPHDGTDTGTDERTTLLPNPVVSGRQEREDEDIKAVVWIININLIVNVVLLAGKVIVAFWSNSISLIASLIDSAMDLLSTIIISWTNRASQCKDVRSIWHYPAGRKRLEPMGIVIFSVFMIASFLQVLLESLQRLLKTELEPATIPLPGVAVMVATIAIKAVVWLQCRGSKNSSVRALAQDAENDCVFNFFSLLFPFVGQKLHAKWLDAVGGLLLSIYIVYEWTDTLVNNVRNLTGRRAGPEQHQRVAYMVTRFSPLIKALQHVHVYQAGDDLIVEVDIIVPPDTPLVPAHDLGESLQYALESLDGVVRAYVHTDFSANPMSGHWQQ